MWQDLAAGVIQAASGSYAAASNVLQSGAGKAIAVPQKERMRKLPDVADVPRAGSDRQSLSAQGLHLPSRAQRHAARDRARNCRL